MSRALTKKATGIAGFDDSSGGGLPAGRLTAVVGKAGAGKTVFALQAVVNWLRRRGETAIIVSFEQPATQVRADMAAFDWDFEALTGQGLTIVEASITVDTLLLGSFDLNALIAQLEALRQRTGAGNIVFDGIDALLSALDDERTERRELLRLVDWLRRESLTGLFTVKEGGFSVRDETRATFIEYLTDCLVLLDHGMAEATLSRTLRIAKYRGSDFSGNAMPMVINDGGINLVSLRVTREGFPVFADRLGTGVAPLDRLLGGGYLRGSSILISGAPGTAKTSLAAAFAEATVRRGERALYVSFDESDGRLVAGMRSIGLNLGAGLASGQLAIAPLRWAARSPEGHFRHIEILTEQQRPDVVIIDPLSALLKTENVFTPAVVETLLDTLKARGITVLCTSLLQADKVGGEEITDSYVSTLADTWMHLSYVALNGERNRALTVVKSRGTAHSNQVRELLLSDSGLQLAEVYAAEGEVLMGSARLQKEAADQRARLAAVSQHREKRLELGHSVQELELRLATLQQELDWKRQALSSAQLDQEAEEEEQEASAVARRAARSAGLSPATGAANGRRSHDD